MLRGVGDFPMLDNGYMYLGATRMSLHRSATDWALVIEVFGHNPRAGLPAIWMYPFGSTIQDREPPPRGTDPVKHAEWIARHHAHDEMHFFTHLSTGIGTTTATSGVT